MTMPNALGLLAEPQMRATPRNKLLGLLADYATQANEFATKNDPRYADKRQNQTLGLLADAVSLGSIAKVLDRRSYGEPLTNAGKANVPLLRPETADVAMMAPLSPRNALAAWGMVGGMADNGSMKAATLWRGTPEQFGGMPRKAFGGSYFSERPQVAEDYAGPGGAVGKFFADESKLKVFDATSPKAQKVLKRIERDYDNATDYKDPATGEYMPLADWFKSGYLFNLGRKPQNEIMESLRAEGYDAVKYLDNSAMHDNNVSWVLFDPAKAQQIK